MNRYASIIAAAGLGLAGAAQAQSTTITATPGGGLSGSVSVPGLPSMGVQAGNGSVAATGPRGPHGPSTDQPGDAYAGPGESVTVRSEDGRSVSSAWTSGPNGVVAGAGSPGSTVTTTTPPAAGSDACHPGEAPGESARTGCRPAAEGATAQTQRGR